MGLSKERASMLWLSMAKISARRVHSLVKKYGSFSKVFDLYFEDKYNAKETQSERKLRELHSLSTIEEKWVEIKQRGIKILFFDDGEYPFLLKNIDDPPYLLYYAGELECLKEPMVAIVGTRNPTAYGSNIAHKIACDLAQQGICVVSGLAYGIDAAAHRGALEALGKTIGVLGSGITVPYPAEHRTLYRQIAKSKGLIISEYPIDSQPKPYHFPHRNRIISGLSLATVFVEGKIKSGGMLTVGKALEQGREVFAVPGHVGETASEGTHAILREGARIATSATDILEDLGIDFDDKVNSNKVMNNLSDIQTSIVNVLKQESLFVSQIACLVKQTEETVMSELSILEIEGLIYRGQDNRFSVAIGIV